MRNFPTIVVLSLWFEGDFDAVVAGLEERHIMLTNEVEHADREERLTTKWKKDMDHLLDLLHFKDSNCGEKHTQSLNSAASDSGTWLLETPLYKNWRDSWGVDPTSLFWLNGEPGSGKTVLTSFVIEDLQHEKKNKRDGSRLLSFFCDYTSPEKSKAKYLFECLLG
ncbi:uncharacterized protein LACBIDRAFT_304017 [Laccaria bicolor S238N-H82]|uniref:Predicted protein n=1 Tax=Laccaria bicolor (strain S238N-H82 / ATCC MYA-4686) TaxID=486041 RepID=B0DKS1_LACBS|nr:uncharacterized protein LACBIDRAFT_304017 [Laccaria bicolor S238N-H82]EDR04695.1 predicted protein [Laccaria bicolor S238N-H82]|eukprot:XP_001884519.1 predicted protein [Laccaria bicolor S238N-H82]